MSRWACLLYRANSVCQHPVDDYFSVPKRSKPPDPDEADHSNSSSQNVNSCFSLVYFRSDQKPSSLLPLLYKACPERAANYTAVFVFVKGFIYKKKFCLLSITVCNIHIFILTSQKVNLRHCYKKSSYTSSTTFPNLFWNSINESFLIYYYY